MCARFYSKADSGGVDGVRAPMDCGQGTEILDGLNCYRLCGYTSNNGSHTLSLASRQIVDLQAVVEVFDLPELGFWPSSRSIRRDWRVDA